MEASKPGCTAQRVVSSVVQSRQQRDLLESAQTCSHEKGKYKEHQTAEKRRKVRPDLITNMKEDIKKVMCA
jgi:hypothetical protein